MISIVLNSFKDIPLLMKTIDSIKGNKIKEKVEIIIVVSDRIEDSIKGLCKNEKQIKFFKDPGKGKSHTLNLVFKILKGRIWIFSEGNSCIGNNSLNELLKFFEEESIACVSGRPISLNSKDNKLGYWSHLLFDSANKIRKELDQKGIFLECSSFLFGFRENITKNIPLDVADDSIIPYLVTKKGYRVKYAEKATVYVKNPENMKDFINQKVKAAEAHEYLEEYAPFFPKLKSFTNEVKKGTFLALAYPRNIKEFHWTILLFFTRLYIWTKVKWKKTVIQKNK